MDNLDKEIASSISKLTQGLAVRGVIAIAFGALVLVWPNISLQALVYLVAAFAAVDGILSLVVAFAGVGVQHRLWLIVTGVAGIAVAAITVITPGITELALVYVIGAWALVVGLTALVVAIRADGFETRYRVFTGAYGAVCIAFGVLMFARPGTGALAVLVLISAYAIVTGMMLIASAIELNSDTSDLRKELKSAMSR